jgi:dTMP kinase
VVLDDFKPDFTLVLDIDVETGLGRAGARGNSESRFENFDRDFHERLRQAFVDIARRNPDRCALIDAAQDENAVAEAIWAAVARRFGL